MSDIVEIGSLREPVELIDPPTPGPLGRIGRIRHANGENAIIDYETLQMLEKRARAAREDADIDGHMSAFSA